jgi:CO/xanthine dehydrogenase Mo-binding subunit
VLPTKVGDIAMPNGGAGRNAVPIYAAPNQAVTSHFITQMPIRTSALRTLGGYFNAVSAEMFADELAAMAGRDPSLPPRQRQGPAPGAVLKRAVRCRAGPASGGQAAHRAGDGRHRRGALAL